MWYLSAEVFCNMIAKVNCNSTQYYYFYSTGGTIINNKILCQIICQQSLQPHHHNNIDLLKNTKPMGISYDHIYIYYTHLFLQSGSVSNSIRIIWCFDRWWRTTIPFPNIPNTRHLAPAKFDHSPNLQDSHPELQRNKELHFMGFTNYIT